MIEQPGEPYAEWDLGLDADRLGLTSTLVASALGSCLARHRAERTTDRATIFIHGAAGTWTTWTPLLSAASATGVTISDPVLIDLPGWGDTRLTDDRREVSITAVGALVAQAATELGYAEWDLVGHSLGGLIVLHMAATWPERARSVGMISGTTFSVIRSVAHPVRRFGDLPAFTMLLAVMRALAPLGLAGRRLIVLVGRTGLLRLVFAPLFRHPRRISRALIDATARDLRPRAFVLAADATRGYDPIRHWRGIRCPVRATRGDRDVFVTERDLDELGVILPATVRTTIPDCGHFGTIERPRAVLRALGFLPSPAIDGVAAP